MNFEEIFVPGLTGKYGEWRYYQVILNVKNITESIEIADTEVYRVKTVDEVEEIYSKKGVSNLLQRAYDPNRLNPIKNIYSSKSSVILTT